MLAATVAIDVDAFVVVVVLIIWSAQNNRPNPDDKTT